MSATRQVTVCRAHVPARRTWVTTLAGTPCIKHTAFSISLKLFQNEELTRKKKGGSFEEPRLRRAGSCGHSPRVSSRGGPGGRRCQPSTSGRTLDGRGRTHRCRTEARRSPGALRAPGTRGAGLSAAAQPWSGRTGTTHTSGAEAGGRGAEPGTHVTAAGGRVCTRRGGRALEDQRKACSAPQALRVPGRLSSRTRPLDSRTHSVRTSRVGGRAQPPQTPRPHLQKSG